MIILIFSAFSQYFFPSRNCLFSFCGILEQPWIKHKIMYLTASLSFSLAKLSNYASCPLLSSFGFCTTHRKRMEGNGAFFWSLQAGSVQWKQIVRCWVKKKGYQCGQMSKAALRNLLANGGGSGSFTTSREEAVSYWPKRCSASCRDHRQSTHWQAPKHFKNECS